MTILSPPTFRSKLARIVMARPRLFICMLLGIATVLVVPASFAPHLVTRGMLGWNVGALIYLAATMRMMFWSSHERMRARAVLHDDGRVLMLVMVVTAAITSLAAIVGELAVAKDLQGCARYLHIALAVVTLLSSWAFTQVTFATHYAHDFYLAKQRHASGGLDFPCETSPDYGDFLYFACIIGTSGQTADVSITGRGMRRINLVHCVLAFFFNATLLALTINIASGLL